MGMAAVIQTGTFSQFFRTVAVVLSCVFFCDAVSYVGI